MRLAGKVTPITDALGGIGEAMTAFVRSLIAAGYSGLTVDASVNDLRQFATFLEGRGVHALGEVGVRTLDHHTAHRLSA